MRACGKDKLFFRARDAHIKQPAFLLYICRASLGLQRQGTLTKPRKEHRREFQPFGAVQRHQPHSACLPALACSTANICLLPKGKRVQQRRHLCVEHSRVLQFLHCVASAMLLCPALCQLPRLFGFRRGKPCFCTGKPLPGVAALGQSLPQGCKVQPVLSRTGPLCLLDKVLRALPHKAQRCFQRRCVVRPQQPAEEGKKAAHIVVFQPAFPPADKAGNVIVPQA